MADITQGGGGGRAGGDVADIIALDKPYDVGGEWNAGTASNIDEMFRQLYLMMRRTGAAQGTGNVVGPNSATSGNFPLYSGTTGKLIANSAYGPTTFATAGDLTSLSALVNTGLIRADVTFTSSDLAGIGSTPIQLVAAPGAGLVVLPLLLYIRMNITQVYTTSPNILVRWAGAATSACMNNAATAPAINSLGLKTITFITAPLVTAGAAGNAGMNNKALQLQGTNATGGLLTGGVATTFYVVMTAAV